MFHISRSPSGLYLATAHGDGTVHVWDAGTLAHLKAMKGHKTCVTCVAWSHDSARIISGSKDCTIRVWEFSGSSGSSGVATLEGHTAPIASLAVSSSGRRIVSGGGRDRTIRMWDAATFQELQQLVHYGGSVFSVAFSPCSTVVVAGLEDHTACAWYATSGTEIRKFTGHTRSVLTVAFSPCGLRLATGSWDSTVRVWNYKTGHLLHTLKAHVSCVTTVAFSPIDDGRVRLMSNSWDIPVCTWNLDTGASLLNIMVHTKTMYSVVFSDNGDYIFSVSGDHTLRKWDAQTGESLQVVNCIDIDIPILAQSIKDGTAHHNINLTPMPLQDHHVAIIAESIVSPRCSITHLCLQSCDISTNAMRVLLEALQMNASIKHLNLYGNKLCEDNARVLETTLEMNYTLTEVSVYWNIPDQMWARIKQSLDNNNYSTIRAEKKLAFEMRLQREGLVPVAKVARIMA